jgi:hypothetical protein
VSGNAPQDEEVGQNVDHIYAIRIAKHSWLNSSRHVKSEAKKKVFSYRLAAAGSQAIDDKPLLFAIAATELPSTAASAQRRRNERVLAPGNVSCGTPHPRSERSH